jgi:hypothetical protein
MGRTTGQPSKRGQRRHQIGDSCVLKTPEITWMTGLRRRERRFESCRGRPARAAGMTHSHHLLEIIWAPWCGSRDEIELLSSHADNAESFVLRLPRVDRRLTCRVAARERIRGPEAEGGALRRLWHLWSRPPSTPCNRAWSAARSMSGGAGEDLRHDDEQRCSGRDRRHGYPCGDRRRSRRVPRGRAGDGSGVGAAAPRSGQAEHLSGEDRAGVGADRPAINPLGRGRRSGRLMRLARVASFRCRG